MINYKKTLPSCDTECVHYKNCKGFTGDKCSSYCDGCCAPEDYTRPANPTDEYIAQQVPVISGCDRKSCFHCMACDDCEWLTYHIDETNYADDAESDYDYEVADACAEHGYCDNSASFSHHDMDYDSLPFN